MTNMDAYKNKLREALHDYAKECDTNQDEIFAHRTKDHYGYQYMMDMDSLALALEERGALQFAISYTRQGDQGEPYLDVSYWSRAIAKQISFGEIVINIENAEQFIEWAATIHAKITALENQLPILG